MPKDSWENRLLDWLHRVGTAKNQLDPPFDRTQVIRAPLAACPMCAYRLDGLPPEHRCPECAFAYDADTTVFQPSRPWFTFFMLAMIMLGSVGIVAVAVLGGWAGLPRIAASTVIICGSLAAMLGAAGFAMRLYQSPPFLAVTRWGITYRGYFTSKKIAWDEMRWLVVDEDAPWLQKKGSDMHFTLNAVIRSGRDRAELAGAIKRAHPNLQAREETAA